MYVNVYTFIIILVTVDIHQPQESSAAPIPAPSSPPIAPPSSPLVHHEPHPADPSSPIFMSTYRGRESGMRNKNATNAYEMCEKRQNEYHMRKMQSLQIKHAAEMKMLAAKLEIMKKQHEKEMELLEAKMEMMRKKHEKEMDVQEAATTILDKVSHMLNAINSNLKKILVSRWQTAE